MAKSEASGFERLRQHLFRMTNEIITEIDSSLYSGSPEAVAGGRENALREILSRFFPRTYDLAKGKIYDLEGNNSDSIDIVALDPKHPKLRNARGEIELLLAEGIHCAIELKPDLSDLPDNFGAARRQKPEIIRALEQVRSVKRLNRGEVGRMKNLLPRSDQYYEYARRIPTHIITGEAEPCALAQYIVHYYKENKIPLHEQVDMIVNIGKFLLINTKAPEQGFSRSDGTWHSALLVIDAKEDALARFLLLALLGPGPEDAWTDPILARYLRKLPPAIVLQGWKNTES